MRLQSIIFSVAIVAVLLCFIVVTRLLVRSEESKEMIVVEVPEEIALSPKAELPAAQSDSAEPIPPAPSLSLRLSSVERPDIQMSLPEINSQSVTLPSVELFTPSIAPAELSAKVKSTVAVQQPRKPAVRTQGSLKPKSTTVSKESGAIRASPLGFGDLDAKPRLLRKGRMTWPRSVRSMDSGVVTLNVELDTKGRVKVIGVVSSPHSALSSAAKRFAAGCRYTVPKKDGVPVKARFPWPIKIEHKR